MAGFLDSLSKAVRWGYDFVRPQGRRRAPDGILRSEDQELQPTERRKMISGARDTHRNFVVGQWAVRKHLDYVSTFNFQSKSGDDEVDTQFESLMRGWGSRGACEVTGRHSLARLARMMEARRTIDGDVFLMRLASGALQAIEGDRIRSPLGGLPVNVDPLQLVHGVQIDDVGRAVAYAVNKRARGTDFAPSAGAFEFERMISAANMYQHAWYERFDQVRGISPMASAFGTLQDLNEGFTYALAKMKISQLFGLIFYREQADQLGDPVEPAEGDEAKDKYQVDLGSGPLKLELDPGDRAEFLESKNPSSEFQAFSQTMIGLSLKALDIPFSFFAENFTNYSGARQALLQYQLSCELKRADVIDLLNWITRWRAMLWIDQGLLKADPAAIAWEWVPKGIPWIDPLKEVQADVQAIGAGLYTRTRALKEQGLDFYEVIDELAREVTYMKEKGLDPSIRANANIVTLEQAA